MAKTKKSTKASRLYYVITASFPTTGETAKILGVSLKRLRQIKKLVNHGKP